MFKIGDTLKPWRIESVSPQNMRDLSAVLRDPNPIHLDPNAVAQLGLGNRVINQGPANLAYIVNMLNAALPGARILQLDARFLANVFGGDAVEASGRVSAASDSGNTVLTCEVWLNVDGRGPAVSGTAVLQLAQA